MEQLANTSLCPRQFMISTAFRTWQDEKTAGVSIEASIASRCRAEWRSRWKSQTEVVRLINNMRIKGVKGRFITVNGKNTFPHCRNKAGLIYGCFWGKNGYTAFENLTLRIEGGQPVYKPAYSVLWCFRQKLPFSLYFLNSAGMFGVSMNACKWRQKFKILNNGYFLRYTLRWRQYDNRIFPSLSL